MGENYIQECVAKLKDIAEQTKEFKSKNSATSSLENYRKSKETVQIENIVQKIIKKIEDIVNNNTVSEKETVALIDLFEEVIPSISNNRYNSKDIRDDLLHECIELKKCVEEIKQTLRNAARNENVTGAASEMGESLVDFPSQDDMVPLVNVPLKGAIKYDVTEVGTAHIIREIESLSSLTGELFNKTEDINSQVMAVTKMLQAIQNKEPDEDPIMQEVMRRIKRQGEQLQNINDKLEQLEGAMESLQRLDEGEGEVRNPVISTREQRREERRSARKRKEQTVNKDTEIDRYTDNQEYGQIPMSDEERAVLQDYEKNHAMERIGIKMNSADARERNNAKERIPFISIEESQKIILEENKGQHTIEVIKGQTNYYGVLVSDRYTESKIKREGLVEFFYLEESKNPDKKFGEVVMKRAAIFESDDGKNFRLLSRGCAEI